jgi:hypothetical protein
MKCNMELQLVYVSKQCCTYAAIGHAVYQKEQLVVETLESAVMWVERLVAGLCGSWASESQEEAGAVVGLAVGLFAGVVEVALER